MTNIIGFYPGCTLKGTAKEYYESTKAVFKVLGYEIRELEDWICCGATSAHSLNKELSIALPAYNLNLAKREGYDYIGVACAACFNRLKTANYYYRNYPSIKDKINKRLKIDYNGEVEVKHILEILRDEVTLSVIKKNVKKELKELNVAPYYGCLLIRPPKIMEFDDPENPSIMGEVLGTTGAKIVDFPLKIECCGAGLTMGAKNSVTRLVGKIVESGSVYGADLISVACPECHLNLDMRQFDARKYYGFNIKLPILFFTQVLGLALGVHPMELGIDKILNDPIMILRQKGIEV